MRREELKERLLQIGANVSEKTLRRWGEDGIIKDHVTYSGAFRPGRGRGNAEDWPEESFLQAAGVWAMANASPKRLKGSELESLRIMGDEIHKRGRCRLDYPDLNELVESNSPRQSLSFPQDFVDLHIPAELVTIRFDMFDDPRHNDLYVAYLCAKEKAWHSIHNAATWPITKPTWAYLYYVELQGSLVFRPDETPEPFSWIELSHSRLEEADDGINKLVFFFDGRDARAVPEIINIHVGDQEA